MEDIDKCFEVIKKERDTVIRLSKEATAAVETKKNEAEMEKAEKRKNTTPAEEAETDEVKDPDQEKKGNISNLLECCP